MLRIAGLILFSVLLSAQDNVPPSMLYHRVWAVVPLIGEGTREDPRRPMFVPSPTEERQRAKDTETRGGRRKVKDPGILSYSMQVSDDGESALVEFVGLTPESLRFITEFRDPRVKVFERGKAKREEISF